MPRAKLPFRPLDVVGPSTYHHCKVSALDVGSCQNYGPFWGTLNIRCCITIWTQKGTIILTITQCVRVPSGVELQSVRACLPSPYGLRIVGSDFRGSGVEDLGVSGN